MFREQPSTQTYEVVLSSVGFLQESLVHINKLHEQPRLRDLISTVHFLNGMRKCKNISHHHISFYGRGRYVLAHLATWCKQKHLHTSLTYSYKRNYLYEQCKFSTNYCTLVPSLPWQ